MEIAAASRKTALMVERPETRYVRSGEAYIAFQAFGSGPWSVVVLPGRITNLEVTWDDPMRSAFYGAIARFAQVVLVSAVSAFRIVWAVCRRWSSRLTTCGR